MASTLTFVSNPSTCQYLSDRTWQLRYELAPDITPAEYAERLRSGWRRFGPVLFRPECPSCQMCQSLRVDVSAFHADESQRRSWKRNSAEVEIVSGPPSITTEKEALFQRFHEHGHRVKGWPAEWESDLRFFTRSPFPIEEWTYRHDGRLIAVGYVDALAEGLSAIYFYWEPEEARRSLGTFNVLAMLAEARRRGLPHVYLGYYVEGYRSLEYKARFRPNQVLGAGGDWRAFRE